MVIVYRYVQKSGTFVQKTVSHTGTGMYKSHLQSEMKHAGLFLHISMLENSYIYKVMYLIKSNSP